MTVAFKGPLKLRINFQHWTLVCWRSCNIYKNRHGNDPDRRKNENSATEISHCLKHAVCIAISAAPPRRRRGKYNTTAGFSPAGDNTTRLTNGFNGGEVWFSSAAVVPYNRIPSDHCLEEKKHKEIITIRASQFVEWRQASSENAVERTRRGNENESDSPVTYEN